MTSILCRYDGWDIFQWRNVCNIKYKLSDSERSLLFITGQPLLAKRSLIYTHSINIRHVFFNGTRLKLNIIRSSINRSHSRNYLSTTRKISRAALGRSVDLELVYQIAMGRAHYATVSIRMLPARNGVVFHPSVNRFYCRRLLLPFIWVKCSTPLSNQASATVSAAAWNKLLTIKTWFSNTLNVYRTFDFHLHSTYKPIDFRMFFHDDTLLKWR